MQTDKLFRVIGKGKENKQLPYPFTVKYIGEEGDIFFILYFRMNTRLKSRGLKSKARNVSSSRFLH